MWGCGSLTETGSASRDNINGRRAAASRSTTPYSTFFFFFINGSKGKLGRDSHVETDIHLGLSTRIREQHMGGTRKGSVFQGKNPSWLILGKSVSRLARKGSSEA